VRRVSVARYIALEGAEGCGKSTQAAALATDLDALLTRETGGTEIGLRIRDILHDVATVGLAPAAELLLTAADRAQHMAEVVAPALAAGRHVVSDRSVYSALAYQGYGRELDIVEVRRINDWALGSRWPDLVVLIDADESTLSARMAGKHLDRFEQEDDAFHRRVSDGFRAMAAGEPKRWVVIDGNGSVDEVHDAVLAAVREQLSL
jgi:dTMP kinase